LEAAADWAVQEWRRGGLGRVLLDEVTPERLMRAMEAVRDGNETLSMNQAVKKEKVARKARKAAKRLGLGAPE
jgi:hypothetical protein